MKKTSRRAWKTRSRRTRMKTEHGRRKGKSVQEDIEMRTTESAREDTDHEAAHATASAAIDIESDHDQETDAEMMAETTGGDIDRAVTTEGEEMSTEESGTMRTIADVLVRARVTGVAKSLGADHQPKGQKGEETDHGASFRFTYQGPSIKGNGLFACGDSPQLLD